MLRATVLLIERRLAQHTSFVDALKKRYEVISVPSGSRALVVASEQPPNVVILDAISMQSHGDRIGKQIKNGLPTIPLIHLLPARRESAADVVLVLPFTARKLTNCIERMLHQTSDEEMILCGPLAMNLSRRVLVANGHETQLTPKLAMLVELFLRNPGKTLDRKALMEHVWQTNYLGDTRTLDVHIRWIRRAIESDPGNPLYLKTVRGVGYRLELPLMPTHAAVATPITLQEL
jgi:DNA-binding response OmpR family regulator